jgi:hypothetical protein
MSSTRFKADLDTSHHGPLHPYKTARSVADSLDRHPQCDGEVSLRCQQELHKQRNLGVPTGTDPKDINLASVGAMQWVLLYFSCLYFTCCLLGLLSESHDGGSTFSETSVDFTRAHGITLRTIELLKSRYVGMQCAGVRELLRF